MNVQDLLGKFIAVKSYEPESANDLLDFARQTYLLGDITILDYRNLARKLENNGARMPGSNIKPLAKESIS